MTNYFKYWYYDSRDGYLSAEQLHSWKDLSTGLVLTSYDITNQGKPDYWQIFHPAVVDWIYKV